jgi:hypothetical protein
MKKFLVLVILGVLVLSACGPTPEQKATQTALSYTSTAAAWTPTPDFTAKLGLVGADLFDGPGEVYPNVGFVMDAVTIIGKTSDCAWLWVVSPGNNDTGWIRASEAIFTVSCDTIPQAQIPPTPQPTATSTPVPTNTPTKTATKTPAPTKKPSSGGAQQNTCMVNSNIIISNRSDSPITIYLTGPGKFVFTIGPGEASTVRVCSGSYNYTVYGTCNGASASGSGRISDGDQVYFQCN